MIPQTPEQQKPQKPWRELLERVTTVLRRRSLTKLAAVVLAIVFWGVVIASDPDLKMEKTFSNAPVSVQGLENLRSRGYTVIQDLSSTPITVKMKAEVTQSNYDRATVSSFSPRLDLAQITEEGPQKVYFSSAYSTYGEVISFEPEYIEVDVEAYSTRSRIPVVVRQTGEAKEDLWVAYTLAEPSQITVSGPKSLVDQVRRAVVDLPMESLSASLEENTISGILELQDANGEPIDMTQLRVTSESVEVDSIRVDVQAYPMRQIPVSLSTAVTGTPAHGYELGEVRIVPESVWVAADTDTLSSLETLHVSIPADVDDEKETVSAESSLRTIAGARYISGQTVLIEAEIQPAEHIHTYTGVTVDVFGLSQGLSGRLSRTMMSVVITGDYDQVARLKAGDIHLFVDAEGLEEGVHTLPVQCRVDGTESFDFLAEMERLTLTITQD